jgi:hypothetical protein
MYNVERGSKADSKLYLLTSVFPVIIKGKTKEVETEYLPFERHDLMSIISDISRVNHPCSPLIAIFIEYLFLSFPFFLYVSLSLSLSLSLFLSLSLSL